MSKGSDAENHLIQAADNAGAVSPWNEDHITNLGDGGLRAAVFGVSDGLVSSIGLILGVYASGVNASAIFASGIAGMLAGAASMAAGEWISMTAQSEALSKELEVERSHLVEYPKQERNEMIKVLQMHGLGEETAILAVNDLEKRPDMNLGFHARFELGIDPEELGSPIKAMVFSFIAFSLGAIFPIIPWAAGVEGSTGFYWTVGISAVCSFVVGMICSKFTAINVWYSGGRQLFVSVVTAAITSGVGYLINLGGITS